MYLFLQKIFADFDSFVIYSGHDKNIEAILNALGFSIFQPIPFASRIVFEIWENDEIHFLKILFNGELLATIRDGLQVILNTRLKILFTNATSYEEACDEKNIF